MQGKVVLKLLQFVLALAIVTPAIGIALSVAANPPLPEQEHRSVSDPVQVTLTASARPSMGEPFALVVTLEATWRDLPDAVVHLEVPEQLSAAGATHAVASLRLHEPVVLEFPLTPLAHGTHELSVSVAATSEDGASLGGGRTGYVVLPEGGDGAFHPDLVPRETRRTILEPARAERPFMTLRALVEPEREAGPEAAAPPTLPPEDEPRAPLETGGTSESDDGFSLMGHATFQLRLCWHYEDEASPPADLPQRSATIQVWDEDDISDDLLAQGVTGSDGCYTSPAIGREDTSGGGGNQDVYVRIHLCNTLVCVQDEDEDFYVYRVDYGTIGGEEVVDLGAFKAPSDDAFGARAFQYANNAAVFAFHSIKAPGFSTSGPQVTVWAPSTDDSCSRGGMFFRRSEDRIHVCSDSDRSPEDIGHEYGHWVHWSLYRPSWPSPDGPHNLCTEGQNRGLAWAEGFGNWYGPRVGHDISAPGADGNVNYDRPWDGSSFSINMETDTCAGTGDDNEMRVAHTLWDLTDVEMDGVDLGWASYSLLSSVVASCDDNDLRDLFDGGGCNWISQGGDACTFMRAAFQNNIDFDDNAPTVALTSQPSFAWVRGVITLAADAADLDQGCVPSVQFRISSDSGCTEADRLVGTDLSPPYSRTFDTRLISDNGFVWTCARASDALENSPWRASTAYIGVDNTRPNLWSSIQGTQGDASWWRSSVQVTLGCSDILSGVKEISYSVNLDSLTPYTGPFWITKEGASILWPRCDDHAGNVDTELMTVHVDTRDPVVTSSETGALGENGWYVGPATVVLECADPLPGSGCSKSQAVVSGPEGVGELSDYAGPFAISGDGVYDVSFHGIDVAGNVGGGGSIDIRIDTQPPAGTLTRATDDTFTYPGDEVGGGFFTNAASITVGYEATDLASGIQRVWVLGGDTATHAGALVAEGEFTLQLPPGLSNWTLMVEDVAGHEAHLATFQVVSVPADTFAGGVDPRIAGWWKNSHKFAYSQAELEAMLVLVNAASHAFGAPQERYAEMTFENLSSLQNSRSTSDERVRTQLAAAWLNLVSGREPAAQAVDVAGVDGWDLVVQDTGDSGQVLALHVVLEVERRLAEQPNDQLLNVIKDLLSALNSGDANV